MNKLLIAVLIFPVLVFGQSVPKTELVKGYSRAIDEYLSAVYKREGSRFDTLVVGKHNDFPDIKLPATIGNTVILLLTAPKADQRRARHKSLAYINMFGWVKKDRAEFVLVTFYPGYTHQFDCMINLQYAAAQKEFKLESLQFKDYAYNQK